MLISICIPSYKSIDLVKRALKSVYSQSNLDFEVIISDDSKSDIIKKYIEQREFLNLTYIKNPNPGNPVDNWNHALKHASGEYVLLLHQDDYLGHTNFIENFKQAVLSKPSVNLWFSNFRNENGLRRAYYDFFSKSKIKSFPERLIFINYFSSPSCMIYSKSILEYYNPNLKWLVDVELYIRLIKKHDFETITTNFMIIGGGNSNLRITNTISQKEKNKEFLFLTGQDCFNSSFANFFIRYQKLKIFFLGFIEKKLIDDE